jgi:hypothetical protein
VRDGFTPQDDADFAARHIFRSESEFADSARRALPRLYPATLPAARKTDAVHMPANTPATHVTTLPAEYAAASA